VVILMSDATTADSGRDRRRWLILGVIGLAQLMMVLDKTQTPVNAQEVPPPKG
jgi:hypothetical protein